MFQELDYCLITSSKNNLTQIPANALRFPLRPVILSERN